MSSLSLWLISYPIYVYKKIFKRSYLKYISESVSQLIVFLIICLLTYYASNIIVIENIWLDFVFKVIVSLVISNILMLIINVKNENFIYYKSLLLNKIKKEK